MFRGVGIHTASGDRIQGWAHTELQETVFRGGYTHSFRRPYSGVGTHTASGDRSSVDTHSFRRPNSEGWAHTQLQETVFRGVGTHHDLKVELPTKNVSVL